MFAKSLKATISLLGMAVLLLILTALCLILFGMHPMFAILIIFLAFLRVAEDFVGFVYLLETFLCIATDLRSTWLTPRKWGLLSSMTQQLGEMLISQSVKA